MKKPILLPIAFPALLAVGLCANCSTVYYGALEKAGVHKRDVLVKRVTKSRDAQEAAKEQFKSALEEFSRITGFDGGDLQTTYNRLRKEYERSESKAALVRSRNDDVESVAKALFREWENETGQFENPEFRRNSENQLRDARNKYSGLIAAMRRAEDRIDPVLRAFRDQVLYLKHNLNARAIASLRGELRRVEVDVGSLIVEMERSIAEANAFIRSLE